jgi:adenylylsulfate kinase-like enzyme
MVIWLTGLSGSGKTTLARALHQRIGRTSDRLVLLDGDCVREAFGDGLGHREKDRVVQVTRVQRMAKLLADQDLVVIVALVYANPELLLWNRTNLRDYFEVHVKASLATVTARDGKGLYAAALHGEKTDVIGVDIPAWEPTSPDLVIDADNPEEPAAMADRVVAAIPGLIKLVEVG